MSIVVVGMEMMQVITKWAVGFAKFMWLERNWRIYIYFLMCLEGGWGVSTVGMTLGSGGVGACTLSSLAGIFSDYHRRL